MYIEIHNLQLFFFFSCPDVHLIARTLSYKNKNLKD